MALSCVAQSGKKVFVMNANDSVKKLHRLLCSLLLVSGAALVSVQGAQASTWDSQDFERHEDGGCSGHHSGCVTTYGSKSFTAFANDLTSGSGGLLDGDSASGSSKSFNISYTIGSGWLVDNAWLWVKAKDDATGLTADSTRTGRDGYEYMDLLTVEGANVTVGAVEVDSGWYFGFDVTQYVTGSHTSPLSAVVASVNLSRGDSDLIFQNAKLRLDYHIDCPSPTATPLPAAAWLFGSALLGFVSLSNRRKV